ncbi:MAG: TIGR04283 family arsenosugar biosynthesis glycosyltransferase [Cyclobacteriaceae bacterium]
MDLGSSVSIIIPTWNEAANIGELLALIHKLPGQNSLKEVIVCDGSSTDNTVLLAKANGAVVIHSPQRQRAYQMNLGAKHATGDILYFLHADSTPPAQTLLCIVEKSKNGFASGCFRLKFDVSNWFLRTQTWFTKFPQTVFRFGDQSLFVSRELFQNIGGYNENLFLMEDQEIIYRIKKRGKFLVMKHVIITSSRKYQINGFLRLQLIFYTIYFLYHLGLSQKQLKLLYQKWITT